MPELRIDNALEFGFLPIKNQNPKKTKSKKNNQGRLSVEDPNQSRNLTHPHWRPTSARN
jgi:hypothetical protein